MRKVVRIEYGNKEIEDKVEFNVNAISISVIVSIICSIYNDKDFVNVYVNSSPIMFFNKNFNSKIKIDLLETLIINAINKPTIDDQMIAYLKSSYLHDTKVKEIKDELPIYRTAEHGCKVDAVSEVPDVKANVTSPVEETSCNEPSLSNKYYKTTNKYNDDVEQIGVTVPKGSTMGRGPQGDNGCYGTNRDTIK